MRLRTDIPDEMVSLLAAADPAFVMRCDGLEPDDWQREICRCNDPRILLLICRQVGKSSTAAAIGVSRMLQHPDTPVIILAPKQDQAKETLRKGKKYLRSLGISTPGDATTRIEIANRSRMLVMSDKNVSARGFSDSQLIILDEASRIDNEIYSAVEPMLAADGQIMMLTTPFGARGLFYAAWKDESGFWRKIMITAEQVPRKYPPDVLAAKRADPQFSEREFAQEYMCEFVDTVDAAFSTADIEATITSDVEPLYEVAP